jgi:hypothetical protein
VQAVLPIPDVPIAHTRTCASTRSAVSLHACQNGLVTLRMTTSNARPVSRLEVDHVPYERHIVVVAAAATAAGDRLGIVSQDGPGKVPRQLRFAAVRWKAGAGRGRYFRPSRAAAAAGAADTEPAAEPAKVVRRQLEPNVGRWDHGRLAVHVAAPHLQQPHRPNFDHLPSAEIGFAGAATTTRPCCDNGSHVFVLQDAKVAHVGDLPPL